MFPNASVTSRATVVHITACNLIILVCKRLNLVTAIEYSLQPINQFLIENEQTAAKQCEISAQKVKCHHITFDT